MSRQMAELKTKLSKIAWIQSEGIKSIGFTVFQSSRIEATNKENFLQLTLSQLQGVPHVFPLAVHLDNDLL